MNKKRIYINRVASGNNISSSNWRISNAYSN
ncbi:MAG: hypothetical protein L6V91_10145 [Bacilli bacterium]|nr:MAG: hypothetical protein L6V91_10145 [Bacilli bacterium]